MKPRIRPQSRRTLDIICVAVSHICPPVPSNRFDWAAWDDDQAPDGAVGYGPTREAAVAELLDELDERSMTFDLFTPHDAACDAWASPPEPCSCGADQANEEAIRCA
jgi:hypothetical protein